MRITEELSPLTPSRDTVLTIGVFDGVHLGHRHLLEQLKNAAQKREFLAGVVTFRNHPRTVLQPDTKVTYLSSLEERLQLLTNAGVDLVIPITFDLPLSHLKAREFVAFLQQYVRMKGLVIGPDFALGHKREGNVQVLTDLGKEMGFSVHVVTLQALGASTVSSTSVKDSLAKGDVATVAKLLGRNFALTGTVSRGEGRGEVLGYPTANLEVPQEITIPGDGIYATWAYIDGKQCKSATSIGVRPTFGPGERTIETFVLDFKGDLYNQEIRLEFAHRLRDELAFDSVEALQEQMAKDIKQTRGVLEKAAKG